MNLIQIAGHLGADAETRFTPSGQKVTNLRVATKSKRGNKEETIWWRVTIWGDRFDKILSYLKKGSAVIVVGELSKPEIYTDKEGNPQVTLNLTAEIIRFSPFGRSDRQEEQGARSGQADEANAGYPQEAPYGFAPQAGAPSGNYSRGREPVFDIQSDDLPF